jgi:hypothetical protein
MMTNVDLENMADKLGLPIVGVFSKDELINDDKAPRQIGSYYVNMQDSTEGNGTHWIFIKIFKSGHGLYFDSFGFPSPKAVEIFLKPFKPYAYNNREIQDYDSDNCGRFCLCADALVKEYDTYNDFLEIWSNNTKENDKIVHKILNDLLNN